VSDLPEALREALTRLERGAAAVAEGALDARIGSDVPAELEGLAKSVDAVAETLARRELETAIAHERARRCEAQLGAAKHSLERAERLASIGQLAAAVAHDVGNPMAALLVCIELARRTPQLDAAAREHLERASREGERIRRILRELLDFARPPGGRAERVDLAELARETCELLGAEARRPPIRFELDVEAAAPAARAERALVAQVLFNLVQNAIDALADRSAPTLRIRIEPARLDRGARAAGERASESRAARAVACSIEDNGPGVAGALRERIFEPFVTTKARGQGTGLGLSNARRHAERCGGTLALAPSETGARFVLMLPRWDGDEASRSGAEPGAE
jgi:signal transduction histidine kinase